MRWTGTACSPSLRRSGWRPGGRAIDQAGETFGVKRLTASQSACRSLPAACAASAMPSSALAPASRRRAARRRGSRLACRRNSVTVAASIRMVTARVTGSSPDQEQQRITPALR
ncbi:hypothetical protein VQ02_26180 [Methylobacterium variabile]|uniref:Uncharacterized protein n=1 Tax=Methylobacterium variabile TaxID=298794 RepID=A0A0J6S7Y1_9HYPH|nr:hypothetical protein VQ02_26180 [Methylobacterium variabile]